MTDTDKDIVARIVCTAIAAQPTTVEQLPGLIASVGFAVAALSDPKPPVSKPAQEPAVPISKSVKPDYIVCLEDGAKLKMLKRYIRTRYDMTPDEYRAKWGLPHSYPMVCGNYSARRRDISLATGLGRK